MNVKIDIQSLIESFGNVTRFAVRIKNKYPKLVGELVSKQIEKAQQIIHEMSNLSGQYVVQSDPKDVNIRQSFEEIEVFDIDLVNMTAKISYKAIGVQDLNNGHNWIEVPLKPRKLQLSARENPLVDQSEKQYLDEVFYHG